MLNPSPYKAIAAAITFSPRFKQVLAEAKRIRDRFSADLRRIYVIRIITTFDQARASIRADAGEGEKPQTKDEEEDALERFVLSAGATEVPIETRCIRGNTGLAASDFVQSAKADLLVVPMQR